MPALPDLTEADLHDWTAPRFVERGRGYYRQDRIRSPRIAERTLKAECQGSQPHPYRVEVTLDDDGIASARCSCPMGEGGRCKHVVALLLTWIDDPDAFASTQTLEAQLERRSKAELVALIGEMIDRHPDLEMLLSLPMIDEAHPAEPIDPEQIRQQVRRALDQADGYAYDYNTIARIERELQRILDLGAQFAERGAAENAVTVYRTFADTLRAQYGDFFDPEGRILWMLSSCSEELGTLLSDVEEQAVRRAIVDALFDIYAWNVNQGGYGISDAAYRALLERAAPEEQHRVTEKAREAFDRAASDRKRKAFAELLLDLDEKLPKAEQMGDDEYLDICRRAGLTVTMIWKLLEGERLDEALEAARGTGDYELYRVADLFAEAGHAEAIREVIMERLAGDPDHRLIEWLRDDAARRDDPQAVFDLSKRLFWERPSVERYRALRNAGQKGDGWTEERAALIERLEQEQQFALLTKIYLEDGDYDEDCRRCIEAEAGFMAWSARG